MVEPKQNAEPTRQRNNNYVVAQRRQLVLEALQRGIISTDEINNYVSARLPNPRTGQRWSNHTIILDKSNVYETIQKQYEDFSVFYATMELQKLHEKERVLHQEYERAIANAHDLIRFDLTLKFVEALLKVQKRIADLLGLDAITQMRLANNDEYKLVLSPDVIALLERYNIDQQQLHAAFEQMIREAAQDEHNDE